MRLRKTFLSLPEALVENLFDFPPPPQPPPLSFWRRENANLKNFIEIVLIYVIVEDEKENLCKQNCLIV